MQTTLVSHCNFVTLRCAWLFALASALLAAGCFDVQQVDVGDESPPPRPSPLEIDDFEDSDRFPTSSLFAAWRCYAWGSETPEVDCGVVEPGNAPSQWAFAVDFELWDPPNRQLDYPGAELKAPRAAFRLDLNRYERIIFSAKFEPTAEALTLNIELRVSFGCARAAVGDGPPPEEGVSLMSSVLPPATFRTYLLPLASFRQPDWEIGRLPSEGACLSAVEDLSFEVVANVSDGEAISGRLTIDDVYLQ